MWLEETVVCLFAGFAMALVIGGSRSDLDSGTPTEAPSNLDNQMQSSNAWALY